MREGAVSPKSLEPEDAMRKVKPAKEDNREPIFHGDPSKSMWQDINEAKTIRDLRIALYHVCCHCQELEAEVELLRSSVKEGS